MRLINTKTFKLEEFDDGGAPPYAILSHTWGPDFEELTFSDFKNGTTDKPGIGSIKFQECCRQAQEDSLDFAWIDTCCIDKTNLVELGEAINSMFRWYSLASVCYAYLSDVPAGDDPSALGSKFRTSRWFKRGWTLQELLAPKHLRFYNAEWLLIGTKGSRCTVIQEITHVPRQILLGVAELRTASVAQRMSWAAQRNTKRAEDLAYCLLGIFGIAMPMIYGEGGKEAFFRLQEQIMKTSRDDSILAWGLNDETSMSSPQKPIEGDIFVEGDILAATPSEFANSGQIVAREQATNPLHSLDIFGGSLRIYVTLTTETGGTFGLLSCGPKYDKDQVAAIPLARINSAMADEYVRSRGSSSVLRPIPASDASPELIHIKKDGQKHISTKDQQILFYDVDLFAKLDLEVTDVVPRSYWDNQLSLISPTNTGQILIRVCQNKQQFLDFVILIDVQRPDSLKDQLYCVFTCHKDTALAKMTGKFQREALEVLQQTSASTASLHLRIKFEPMEGDITSIIPQAMTRPPWYTINATMALESWTTMLESTRLLRQRKKNKADIRQLNQGVDKCKSHLGDIEKKRETVEEEIRRLEATKSVLAEEEHTKLKEMRNLEEKRGDIGKRQIENSQQVVDVQKQLKAFYYTKSNKVGWTPFHSAADTGDLDIVDVLFDETTDIMVEDQRWMQLITASIKGDANMIRSIIASDETELDHKDAILGRTALSWAVIQGHPDVAKQLLDTNRVNVRLEDNHGKTPLRWALDGGHYEIVRLMLQRDKPARSRKLYGHSGIITTLAFSHDSRLILSGSDDHTTRLWNRATGECLHTFQGHSERVSSVAFSHNSKILASGSNDDTIKLWDSTTGKCLHTLQGHSFKVSLVAFSHNSKILASGSGDTIKLWDSTTGTCLHTLQGHSAFITSVAFSHDLKILVSGSGDTTIKLRDSTTSKCLHTLQGHSAPVCSVAFSHDSRILVSGSGDYTIKLWDSTTGKCLHTLQGHSAPVRSVAFSHDSKLVLSGSDDNTIKLWDSTTGECIYTLNIDKISYYDIRSVAFSHDSKSIIAAVQNDIKLWDMSIVHELVTSSGYQDWSKRKQLNEEDTENVINND